jgi:hypothetical protein
MALLLLNASLTFQSLWPTPAVRWTGELSIELAVCLLAAVVASQLVFTGAGAHLRSPATHASYGGQAPGRRSVKREGGSGVPGRGRVRRVFRAFSALTLLSVVWLLMVVGHYADVTAQALYGREINLYWDLRFMPDVAAMLAKAAPLWLILIVVAAVVLAVTLLYLLVRWALDRIARALRREDEPRVLGALAAVAVILFAIEQSRELEAHERRFPAPVTATYLKQARVVADAIRGGRSVAPSPPMNSDFSRVSGADVLLIFVESYGAVSYDRPEFARALAAPRADLNAAIRESGRRVVSAFVESPTFGGVSWLAHITLMSGVEVRDPHTNAVLMTQQRDTLVRAFSRRGFRTVALMPGLWQRWPEGSFYGFDDIYGGERLAYRGPQFGWFSMTDQYALAKLDQLEIGRPSRQPLFVFFPTISTHTPFTPTPPYQADWPRMLTDRPYELADIDRAYQDVEDWLNLSPGYAKALSYSYTSLAGYLRRPRERDFVMILIGDHQPPAAVSGERAPWDVPVHVIAGRAAVLDRLRASGFRDGLTPERPRLGRMHELLPLLLNAFGDAAP